MKYGEIKGVKKPVSRIVFGTANRTMFNAFRSVYGESSDFQSRLDSAFRLLDDAYEMGINCFDCADHYGEEPLGEWMQSRGVRSDCVILTKGAHHNRWRKRVTDYDILHDANNSLAKLKTDFLDLYLLHRDDETQPVGPIMDALNRLVREGKTGVFGASNWTAKRMDEANVYALHNNLVPFTVASPNFGLAVQVADPWGGGCVGISGSENALERRWYAQNGVPVFAYSPLGRGFFSGKFNSDDPDGAKAALDEFAYKGYYCEENMSRLARCEKLAKELGVAVADVAGAWIFSQSEIDAYAIISTTNRDHMAKNVRALDITLTQEQCRYLCGE